MITANASEIIAALLVKLGLAVRPSSTSPTAYRVTTGNMPDSPDLYISIYDTGFDKQGKFMDDGQEVHQPSLQIRLRSRDNAGGMFKMRTIAHTLSALSNETVTTNTAEEVVIPAVTIVTGPMFLTQEENRTRQIFVMNIQIADPED